MVCPKSEYNEEENFEESDEILTGGSDDDEEEELVEDDDYYDREAILSTYNPEDVISIKEVLEDAEIDYHFEGDVPAAGSTYTDPARLFVDKDQADEVRELIDDLDLTYMSISPDEDPIEYDSFDDDLDDN